MKRKSNILKTLKMSLSAMMMLATGVSCDRITSSSGEGETVSLVFDSPSITQSVDSKASVDGSNFPYSHEAYRIGVWLMHEGDLKTPQIDGFDNLKADYLFADGVNNWTYYPFGSDQPGESSLHILKQRAVDIYAYHPWVPEAEDLTQIPFVSGEDDWMVSIPLNLTAAETGSSLSRTLTFQHLMTCIEVRIQCKYEGSISLTSMTLTDSKGRLVASGTFDCTKADVSAVVAGTTGNAITVTPKRSLRGGYWISTFIIMPPVSGLDLSANEMKLSFVFNNIAAETEFYLPATMIVNGVSQTVNSFQRGYKYIYNLTLDNTMDFRPVGIEQQWKTEIIPLPI